MLDGRGALGAPNRQNQKKLARSPSRIDLEALEDQITIVPGGNQPHEKPGEPGRRLVSALR